jgi:hypothetical protein
MHVVGHQTKAVHPIAEPSAAFLKQGVEHLAVFRAEEDLLLGVATQDHVVHTTWQVKARLSGHREVYKEPRALYNNASLNIPLEFASGIAISAARSRGHA